jgi:hypothetical protein
MFGKEELGLNGSINETYELIDSDKATLVHNLKDKMLQDFGVTSQFEDFPLMYWTVKFHKNPIKFRPISGSKNKVLNPLEKVGGCILKKLTFHFMNYCKKAEQFSGFKHYFAVKNSSQTIEILNRLKGNATSFDAYDFSNLYTNFEHNFILERLEWLVDLLFNHSGKSSINVFKNFKKSEYSDEPLNNNKGWSFSREKVKSLFQFLIKNTYIEFGDCILRQKCGVPMGSIPAPDFANLALAVDEFKFVQKMIKEKNRIILRKLNFM